LVNEIRGMIVGENQARIASLRRAVAAGNISESRANARIARIQTNMQREAAAVSVGSVESDTGGVVPGIVVRDVYAQTRGPEARRSMVGSSTYERMLFVANDRRTVTVGIRPRGTMGGSPMLPRDGSLAGISGRTRTTDARTGERGTQDYTWVLPVMERSRGVSDTLTHEIVIHIYREWAGMPDQHANHVVGVASAPSNESAADGEAHFLWSVAPGEKAQLHGACRGRADSSPDQPLPYLPGPVSTGERTQEATGGTQ